MPHKDLADRRAWRLRHRDRLNAYARAYRAAHPQVLEDQRALAQAKQEHIRAQCRRRYTEKREEINAQRREYRARTLNTRKAQRREYRARNAARINEQKRGHYATHPEYRAYVQIKSHERYLNNHEAHIGYSRSRRARLRNAPINDLTPAQWLEIQAAQDHRCYYCGKRCKGHLSQDHITPLSKGGSHTLANVIGACKSCNSSKHTRNPPIPVQPLLLTIAPAKKKGS